MTTNELIDQNNVDLPDRTNAGQPRVEIGTVRGVINRLTAFVGSLYKFEVPNADTVGVATQAAGGLGYLTIVANMLSGSSDLAFLNTNIRSRMFSFWHYVDGNIPKLGFIIREKRIGVGGIVQPQETIDADGRVRTWGLVGSGNAPTAATLGTGLGTSGSIAMDATASDMGGRFSITTGSNPNQGQMARITFASPYARVPSSVVAFQADPDAAQYTNNILLYFDSPSSMVLTGTNAGLLPANKKLEFNYIVVG